MISHKADLLLFDQAINYHPRAEVWLLKVEYRAQEIVGKMIGNAVGSFPKQPLDEWIIDYPQQTILSTIHLILTHEVNEMLHEMRAHRKSEDPSMTQSGPTDTMGLVNESSKINTRSMHQLQEGSDDHSQASNNQRSRETPKEEADIKSKHTDAEPEEVVADQQPAEGEQDNENDKSGKKYVGVWLI